MRMFLLTALLCLPLAATAEPLQVGSQLEAFSIEDQFGNTHAIDGSLRAILFTRDMEAGEVVKAALSEDGPAQLAGAGALYVSDVSGMPGLVRRIFAIPSMRKRPYAMGLDVDGSLTRDFPSVEARATLLVLEELEVTRIEELGSPEALRAALAGLAGPASGATETPAQQAP